MWPSDPIEYDPRPTEDREMEQRREQDDALILDLLRANPHLSLTAVWRAYHGRQPVIYPMEYDIAQYGAEYGWGDLLRVLALAVDAYEDARRRG